MGEWDGKVPCCQGRLVVAEEAAFEGDGAPTALKCCCSACSTPAGIRTVEHPDTSIELEEGNHQTKKGKEKKKRVKLLVNYSLLLQSSLTLEIIHY